jgi:UPF0755 protein
VLRFMIQTLKVSAVLVLAVAIVFTSQRALSHYLDQAAEGQDVEPVTFTVHGEETPDSVGERLEEQGIIRSGFYFEMRMRLGSSDRQLSAGEYELSPGMAVSEIIDEITTTGRSGTMTVRFQEGWRTEQYADHLVEIGLLETTQEFMTAVADPQWDFDFLATRPADADLEGYLFPDTYEFHSDATAEEIITTLLETFDARVPLEMRERAADLGYNFHNVMTIASIVEREAVIAEERPIIASVFYNRMDETMPLQADPTVQYVAGEPGNWWPEITQDDINRMAPHNTYQRPGIPPWPIANPSLASIEAALDPADTDHLFFVATGDGSGAHRFAETYEEHQQNIELARQGQ